MHQLFAKDDGCLGCALLCAACCFVAGNAVASPFYTVKQGDTLWGIARAHKMSYERLCELNSKPYDWCQIKVGQKIMVSPVLPRPSEERLASFGTPYEGEPKDAELLNEYGDLALFSGKTKEDIAFNAEPEREKDLCDRNSLFLRRRKKEGGDEWRLVMTSGGDWKDADCMGDWGKIWVGDVRDCCKIVRASFSKDGRFVWMVCDPSCSFGFDVVCRLDLREKTLAVLIDGDTADEQPDGTILVKGKKTYLSDENGEPLGARWHDVWMTPDGKVVRKGKLWSADELAELSNEASDKED